MFKTGPKTFENQYWIARCQASKTLSHATNTIACDIFGHRFHFDAFSTFFDGSHLHDMLCIRFQESFQIDAFSMKTLGVLVWTEGLSASKCMRGFQTKSH